MTKDDRDRLVLEIHSKRHPVGPPPSKEELLKRGLLSAARRMVAAGRMNEGSTYFSIKWMCPHELKTKLDKAGRDSIADRYMRRKALKEIALGNPRSSSLAKALLGEYNAAPNSIGYYP